MGSEMCIRDRGWVRVAMFGAMAALLVVSLAIPEAFGDLGLLFAISYAVFRAGQLALFWIASADEPELRNSIAGFGTSTLFGLAMLVVATTLDGTAQLVVFALAISLDLLGPYVRGSSGWQLMPEHFSERHRLIIIIALGESIVAIGVGAESVDLTTGIIVAAVAGIALAAAQWWAYFDVVALVAGRRLAKLQGRERNEMARDSYSYLHFPMIAGIVLVALAEKKTIGHTSEALKIVPAVALLGGLAMYLLAHVAFRYRNIHSLNRGRLLVALLYLALIPLAVEIPALAMTLIATAIFCALIAYEAIHFAESRNRIRHELAADLEPPPDSRAQTF